MTHTPNDSEVSPSAALAIIQKLPVQQPQDVPVDVEPFAEIIRQRYGFLPNGTPPLDLNVAAAGQALDTGFLSGILGFRQDEDSVPALLEGPLLAWIAPLLQNAVPPLTLSDLVVEDPKDLLRALRRPFVIVKVRILQSDSQIHQAYLFKSRDVDEGTDFEWDLVVDSALTACEVTRRGWGPHKTSLLREFVQRGIPFRLLRQLPMLSAPSLPLRTGAMPRGDAGLGWRVHGFKASPEDYAAYEVQRDKWLREHSNAHAALAQGGIIWRLARHSLDVESLFNGPRGDPERQGKVVMNDIQYVEDVLSEHEEQLICGVYHVLNGHHPVEQRSARGVGGQVLG